MKAKTPQIPDSLSASRSLHLVHRRTKRRKRRLLLLLVVAAALSGTAVVLFVRNWPFTEAKILADLGEATSSQVEIKGFKQTFIPSPGCIAENVTFRRGNESTPLITVQKLTIRGSYSGLFTKHVSTILADGTHIVIPPLGRGEGWPTNKSTTQIVVGELIANGAVLFTSRNPGKQPLKFGVHDFHIHDLGGNGAMSFETDVWNPTPPGEVHASGKLGPWKTDSPIETPISGKYSFRHADLGVF